MFISIVQPLIWKNNLVEGRDNNKNEKKGGIQLPRVSDYMPDNARNRERHSMGEGGVYV
jgi:hypothetical protein